MAISKTKPASMQEVFTLKTQVLYQKLILNSFSALVKAAKPDQAARYIKLKTYAIAGVNVKAINSANFDTIMEKAHEVLTGGTV